MPISAASQSQCKCKCKCHRAFHDQINTCMLCPNGIQSTLVKSRFRSSVRKKFRFYKTQFSDPTFVDPPTAAEPQHGQAAKLAVKDMIDRPPRMYNSLQPPGRPHQRSSILQKRIFTFNYFRPFRSRPLARLSFINAGPTIPWNSTLRPHQSWN